MPLVTLQDVDVRLWGAEILSGVSFELRRDESWAVLGGNGAGKTTLLELLRGEVWPHPTSRGRRLYHLDGEPSESPIGARQLLPLVSAEEQDAYLRHDWDLTVEEVVSTGFEDTIWPSNGLGAAQRRRIEELLQLLGIAALRDRSFLEISTGEARKALLARALAPGPRALLLDEPCNGLDAPSRRSFLESVSRIARSGTPVVFATHRYEEIVPEVSRVALLERGRIVASGPREEMLARMRNGAARAPGGAAPSAAATATSSPAATAASTPEPASADAPPALVEIEDADVLLEGRRILRGITWRIRRGESWVVRGPNGSGKSTLLRLVAADLQPAPGGRVARLGLPDDASVWDVKERIGVVAPLLQARQRYDVTGEEVVLSGFFASIGLPEEPSAPQRAAARRWVERLGREPRVRRRLHSLSYGELRKLLVARALVRDPALLLLDEPFNGLDPPSREELKALLARLAASGTHLVVVTHHEEEVFPALNRLAEMREGRMVRQGPLG